MTKENIVQLADHRAGGAKDFERVATEMLKACRSALDGSIVISERQIGEIGRRVGRAAEAWCSESHAVPIQLPDHLVASCACDLGEVLRLGVQGSRAQLLDLVTLERVLAELEALCGTEARIAVARILAKQRPGSFLDV